MSGGGRGRGIGLGALSRREFLEVAGAAGGVAAGLAAAPPASAAAAFPVRDVAPVAGLAPGASVAFSYPDDASPALLIRLADAVPDGVGPGRDLVAYSVLCTHKGCPVAWHPEQRMLVCPCHWSSFDPAKGGALVIGQASEPLPRIALRVDGGMVRAVGVEGLVYGRHTDVS